MLSGGVCDKVPIATNAMEDKMAFTPANPVVWAEIFVKDLAKAVDFYNATFDYGMSITTDMGPQPMAIFPSSESPSGVSANLTQGTPGGNSVIHLLVPDTLEAATERARAAGGHVDDEVVDIPPGRFSFATDPDGNRIGLFQPRG